jgi:glycerophosphoryl diester phosphodiesterase
MFGWLFRIFSVVLLGAFISLSGIYLYFSSQKGEPAMNRTFFSQLNKRPLVIAHRGGAGLFPENTLHAFQESWKLGVDVLEMDIHETADGQLVVFHDRTVDRTTDGAGKIGEKTLEEVKRLNAGFNFTIDGGQTFPFRAAKITVPTLKEVFEALPDGRFNIEMKPESATIAASLCGLIRDHKLSEKVIVASVGQTNLDNFRRECPEVATSASASEITGFFASYQTGLTESFTPPMSTLQTLKKLGGMQIISREFVETAHKRNLQVHVWTINQPEEMRDLIETGVDGIMTDYPDRLLNLLK